MGKAHPGGFVRIPPDIDRSENWAGKTDPNVRRTIRWAVSCFQRKGQGGCSDERAQTSPLECYFRGLLPSPAHNTPWIFYSWAVDLPQWCSKLPSLLPSAGAAAVLTCSEVPSFLHFVIYFLVLKPAARQTLSTQPLIVYTHLINQLLLVHSVCSIPLENPDRDTSVRAKTPEQ